MDSEIQEDSILYELVVFSEWSLEQDVVSKPNDNWPWKLVLSYLKKYNCGAYHITPWINQHLPWLFAVGAEGKAVAVLQDAALEIRTLRDNYSAPIGKTFITKDSSQQWRKMQWSPDGSLLAIAHSSGSVDVYDLLASHLYLIPSPRGPSSGTRSPGTIPENALAGLAFIDTRTKNAHWSYELLCLDYHGQLNAYFVSPTQGFEPSHTFSFSSQLTSGITALCVDHSRHLLILASPTATLSPGESENGAENKKGAVGTKFGLSTWRIIDEQPYYVQAPGEAGISSKRWLSFYKSSAYDNTIVKLSPSSDGVSLAAIHLSGSVSIWSLPTLKCLHFWPLERQPGYDELSPTLLQLPAQRRIRSPAFQNPLKFHPVDLDWWSTDSVILARSSGAVSVCEVSDLHNKLGSSAEFFDGSPRISPAYNGTFLGLECEVQVQRKRLQPSTEDSETSSQKEKDEEADDLIEDEEKYLAHRMVRSLLYWVTDSERFQPPRKRPKLLSKTYRLLGLKRTTPEELYIWKLDAEEYGEALALARAYGLDCDLVYQRQWRNAPASIASIHDYLSKVTKRNWLLRECLERVPNDIDAARELLLYGLKNTDLAVFVGDASAMEQKWSPMEYPESEAEILKKEEEKRRKWLARIDFDNLTVEQKMLISTRRRLLQFLDRLSIYEKILGGPAYAGQRYEASFFESFRSQSAVESTAKFARQGEWQAVAVMFTFNGSQTLPHRLAICSSFPETLRPFEYRSVLPECDVNGHVFFWEQQDLREADWCECPAARLAVDVERVLEAESVEQFYSEEERLKPFRAAGVELNSDLVSLWYKTRGADIEKQSMIVENALDLIKLGLERNVPHLEQIHHQLLTLETLVYDLHHEHLDLEKLTAMSELNVCQLLMSRCNDDDSFLPSLDRWLMPYLRRLDTLTPGCITNLLRGVLLERSRQDLGWALQVCTNSKTNEARPVVAGAELLISLSLDCIYACQQTDQLEVAMKLYDCLPERPSGSKTPPELSRLHDRLDQLQSHLEAADILENHEIYMTPSVIAAKQLDAEQSEQLFVRLTRTFMRKAQPPTENQWKEVLQDMLELQKKVFQRVSPQLCYEILVGSLLSSSKKENITSASLMLQLDPNHHQQRSAPQSGESGPRKPLEMAFIPFERSKQLILETAEEYFNSSENLSDPCLELANYCLGLITVEDEQIKKEKDLINAVHLLYDYHLDMPPLKIRLSRNRLVLVEQVLKLDKKAYKNAARLLRLGHLLRACGDGDQQKELEGQILVRIAETALIKQDFDVAGQTCNKLRLANHSIGWNVCSRFAKLDQVDDLNLKMDLISFALVYCPIDFVEELLQLRWKLEHEQLRNRCSSQIDMYMSFENGSESVLSLMDPSLVEAYRKDVSTKKQQSKETSNKKSTVHQQLLQTTTETTKTLVDAVKNTLKLKDALLQQPKGGETRLKSLDDSNRECTRWGSPVFYWNVRIGDNIELYESRLSASYRLFSLPESTNSELNLLTWSWRMEILKSLSQSLSWSVDVASDDLLAKLAECLFPDDSLLALGHLLDLKDATKAWGPLTRLPSTEITLQTAAYYFSLQLLRCGGPSSTPLVEGNILGIRPRRLIQLCSNLSDKSLSEDERKYYELLKRSLRLLADVSEAQQLRRLDGGVDINRFTTDDDYKRDTIVGLAITTDAAVYSASVRLAAHYGVSAWEVTFSHLTALFAEEKIDPALMMRYMEEHKMRDTLFQDTDSLGRKMVSVIYPSISGRDHARLSLFFELMKDDTSMDVLTEPPASVYLQVLHKVESIKGVDVKKLMSSVPGFRREVELALDEDNVGKLAKLAQFVVSSVKGVFSSSGLCQGTVHSIWVRKHFFQLRKENGNLSAADWLHRFESCKNHVKKLSAQEFLQLVDGLCFSNQSLEELPLNVRSEICRRSVNFDKSGKDSEEVRSKLRKWCEHLDRLKSDEYGRHRLEIISCADGAEHYWTLFDQSRAEETALHRLLMRALVEGRSLSVVRLLVGIFPSDFSSTPEDVLFDALRYTLDYLRKSGGVTSVEEEQEDLFLEAKKDAMQVLLHLLTQVRHVLDENPDGIGLITQSDIDDMLRQFYDDDAIDIQVRLRMLHALPPDFAGPAESGSRVQWFRTLALIHETWTKVEEVADLSEDDLKDSDRRRVLFDRLLEMSNTGNHLFSLGKLLHFWPPFSSEREPVSTPWFVLWKAMTELPSFPTDPLILDALRLALQQKPALSDQCIRFIYQSLEDSATFASGSTRLRLHVALRSSLEPLMDDMFRFLDATSVLKEEDYDSEILDLILEKGLVGRFASTPLYGPLCERILSTPETSQVNDIARQLVHHGHRSEAGHLLQLTSGLPRYLLNLSSSLYFARKKL